MTKSVDDFHDMPGFLRFLIAQSLASIILVLGTILQGSVVIEGQRVGAQAWWTNGSGILFTVIIGFFFSAGVLMLKRARFCRVYYLVSWAFLYLGTFLIDPLNGIPSSVQESIPSVVFGFMLLVVFAIYLYFNKRAVRYFSKERPVGRKIRRGY